MRFVKLNSDENQELAGRLGIRGIPTMILFCGGKEVARVSGAISSADMLADRFAALDTKPIGLSTDTVEEHLKWIGPSRRCRPTTASGSPCPLTGSPARTRSSRLRFSNADAKSLYPQGWNELRPCLRLTKAQ